MEDSVRYFISVWIKFFVLLGPFCGLSMFLALTRELDTHHRRQMARRVTLAVLVTCFCLYFFGEYLFALFGVTLDSFRVGAGILLFLSAVAMVQGAVTLGPSDREGDATIVPLTIPIIVGPATTGALLVMGAEVQKPLYKVLGCGALLAAVLGVGVIFYLGAYIERVAGKKVIDILSKLTGLFLAALAAQLVLTGVRHLLQLGG